MQNQQVALQSPSKQAEGDATPDKAVTTEPVSSDKTEIQEQRPETENTDKPTPSDQPTTIYQGAPDPATLASLKVQAQKSGQPANVGFVDATAENLISSGTWGTSKWDITTDGVLTVHAGQLDAGLPNWLYTTTHGDFGTDFDTVDYIDKIKKIVLEPGVVLNANSTGLFSTTPFALFSTQDQNATLMDNIVRTGNDGQPWEWGLTNLTEIDGLDHVDTSHLTDMTNMFAGDSSLKSLDLSSWDVSHVTSMYGLFSGNKALQTVNLANWDTSNVTDTAYTFNLDTSLNNLDVSKWNTSKVTSMKGMFRECSSLHSLAVGNWDTSNLKDISLIFNNTPLDQIDIKNWNVSQLEDASYAFSNNPNVRELDFSHWNLTRPADTQVNTMGIFDNDSNLHILELNDKFRLSTDPYTYDTKLNVPTGNNTVLSTSANGVKSINQLQKWQAVSSGSLNTPTGTIISPDHLVAEYRLDSADIDRNQTWVWQQVAEPTPIQIELTKDQSKADSFTFKVSDYIDQHVGTEKYPTYYGLNPAGIAYYDKQTGKLIINLLTLFNSANKSTIDVINHTVTLDLSQAGIKDLELTPESSQTVSWDATTKKMIFSDTQPYLVGSSLQVPVLPSTKMQNSGKQGFNFENQTITVPKGTTTLTIPLYTGSLNSTSFTMGGTSFDNHYVEAPNYKAFSYTFNFKRDDSNVAGHDGTSHVGDTTPGLDTFKPAGATNDPIVNADFSQVNVDVAGNYPVVLTTASGATQTVNLSVTDDIPSRSQELPHTGEKKLHLNVLGLGMLSITLGLGVFSKRRKH